MRLSHAVAIVAATAILGIALIVWSLPMPVYADHAKAQEVLSRNCSFDEARNAPMSREDRRRCTDLWFADMAAVRTSKWPLQDRGLALIAFAATVAGGIWYFRRDGATSWRELMTPRTRIGFLLTGMVIWGAQLPAHLFALGQNAGREMFPHWADSLGIPIHQLTWEMKVTLPIVTLLGIAALWRAKLPTSLWHWDRGKPWRCWGWSMLCAVATALLVADVSLALVGGRFLLVPLGCVGVYLVLSARAAMLSRRT